MSSVLEFGSANSLIANKFLPHDTLPLNRRSSGACVRQIGAMSAFI